MSGRWTCKNRPGMREGVLHLPDLPADVFFVTLQKTERDYSPTTMYQDYAINDRLFHWQSQSTTSSGSPTGLRYIEHQKRGYTVLLFGREQKSRNGLAQPFFFLGPAQYVDHIGSRPMSITWRLDYPLPARLVRSEVTESRDSRRPAAAGGCWQRAEFLRTCDRDRTSTRSPRPCYPRSRSPGHCLGTQRMRVQPHIGPSDVTRSEVEHSAKREPDVPNRGIVRRSVFNALDAAGRRTLPGRTLRTDRGNPIIPFVGEHVGITQHGANRA
jgi:hypothetical protein